MIEKQFELFNLNIFIWKNLSIDQFPIVFLFSLSLGLLILYLTKQGGYNIFDEVVELYFN